MTVVNYDSTRKGRFTKLTHAILVCTTLIRFCGLIYLIIGVLMITRNGVLHRAAFPFLNQIVIDGMPLGNLSSGIIYALFSMFPLHTIFGLLGFFGVFRQNKIIIIIHTVFLLFGVIVDIVLIVLLSMTLHGINSWVKSRFNDFYTDFQSGALNDEVYSAFEALFGAMRCDPLKNAAGCWEQYYPVMDGNIWIFISLLSISIILEIVNIVLSDLVYRRLDRQGGSHGMLSNFGRFIKTSWTTQRKKLVFVILQVFDMITSFVFLIGGAVISRSRFIVDELVHPVFENLRFNNYYLPEIVIGLAVTAILIGCLNLLSWCIGFNMLCFKSGTKSKVHMAFQIVMVVLALIALIFWTDLLTVVKHEMSDQLAAEFLVYGESTALKYSRAWNAIFLTYSCCGVQNNEDFIGTPFTSSVYERPDQCRVSATLANTNTDLKRTPSFDYNTMVCDEPLKDEIQTYSVLFGVTCGALVIIKTCNAVMIHRNVLGMEDSDGNEPSFSETIRNYYRDNRWLLIGSIAFTGIGVMLALGLLVTGLTLRFNALLGHKDIQPLFKHVYISGWDVTYLVTIMSDVIITWGVVSFIIFGTGTLSAAVRITKMYYVSTVLLLISLLFKCVCILVWIPMRISIDSNLSDAMKTALRNNYKTDIPHTKLYMEEKNLGFNTLFYQGKCCLNEKFQYLSANLIQADFPWTCRPCDTVTSMRWPLRSTVTTKCSNNSHFSLSCADVVLDDAIHPYDTTAVTLGVFMILLEVVLIVVLDRVYKNRVSPGQRRGMFSHICFNNRFINNDKMPNFTLLTVFYVSGNMILSVVQLSAWIAILIYVIRGDSQLDQLSLGPQDLGDMTLGASITVLVVIPISIIINFIKIRWCLIKWNAGLRWSLLPEAGLLIIDVVIFCMCAQQLELIRLSNQNIYPVMYRVNFAYLCVSIFMQFILILIKDRLHKHIDVSFAKPQAARMFSTLWQKVVTHRYFTISGKRNNKLIGFTILSILIIVWEIAIWVVVLVQGFTPGYIKGEFLDELYSLHSVGRFTVFYSYGYLLWGLTITTLVGEIVYVIVHVLTIVAAIRQHKGFIYVASAMLVLVLLADITMTGLAGVLLDTAYNCNARTNTNTAVSQKFCTGLVSKLYDLSGVFIGLTVWHSVLVALLIWLCMSLASKANGPSSISPTEHSTRRTNNRSDSPASLGHSSPDIVVSEFF